MLLVDTIYFLLHANSFSSTLDANCSRTGLEPKERFRYSFGWSVDQHLAPSSQLNFLLPAPPLLFIASLGHGWYLQKVL